MKIRKSAHYVEAAKAHAARAVAAEAPWAEQHWRDAAILWAKAREAAIAERRA